jgi:hypothetical protein
MNRDKLESLRRLAADERTPVDEARNAALAFVRGLGEASSPDVLGRLEQERDEARREVERLKAKTVDDIAQLRSMWEGVARAKEEEAGRLRAILTKLVDARRAEDDARKVREQAETDAVAALAKKEPPKNGSPRASSPWDPRGGWAHFDPWRR